LKKETSLAVHSTRAMQANLSPGVRIEVASLGRCV